MKSLFFRVLALLLTSFLVVVAVSFFLFRSINPEIEPGSERMRSIVRDAAVALVENYARGDIEHIRHRLGRHRIRAWVEDEAGKALVEPGAPAAIRAHINAFPQVVYPHENPAGRFFIFSEAVDHEGSTYHVILMGDRKSFHRHGRSGYFLLPLFAMLAGLVAGSAALSYWMLRPLKTLRDTAGAISGENLTARIPENITDRRDAFGALGEEFNQMTERLETSIDSQKQLLRDVSHELRSPLARIQVAASLWARHCNHPESHERIDEEICRLDSLIDKLLSLSRLQSGSKLQCEQLDLVQLAQQRVEDANFEFAATGRSVTLSAPPSLELFADPSLIGSAIENIVRNALRHSPVTGVVNVVLERSGGSAIIRVVDQGPGVSVEHLDRIFEPFFRADEARASGSGEHGVGLALTRAIAESHGGSIKAINLSPNGLEVRIVLPLE